MQLSSVDRTAALRAVASDVAAPVAAKVVPVAPVNPAAASSASQVAPQKPGVINDIDPKVQARAAADAARIAVMSGSPQANENLRNWTKRMEEVGKVEPPPKEPISKMLMQHIQTLWMASAKAVEVTAAANQHPSQNMAQIQQLAEQKNQDPATAPGSITKEVLTYTPSEIKKNDKSDQSGKAGR
ncbi:MAG: hypothetical protein EBQ69_02735 [Betaproteobacteria bacterium]|nr:hypothetical protein [Betaproteobacteria bacterium]